MFLSRLLSFPKYPFSPQVFYGAQKLIVGKMLLDGVPVDISSVQEGEKLTKTYKWPNHQATITLGLDRNYIYVSGDGVSEILGKIEEMYNNLSDI